MEFREGSVGRPSQPLADERGPTEPGLRKKAETDRVCEGISEGFRSALAGRVARGGAEGRHPDGPYTQVVRCLTHC